MDIWKNERTAEQKLMWKLIWHMASSNSNQGSEQESYPAAA